MLKINYMSTLFVGIDVSSKTNVSMLWTLRKTNISRHHLAITSLALMNLSV